MKRITGANVPLGAPLFAFVFGALMILALGANPLDGLGAMIDGAFGTGDRLAATAVRATPLLLVGVGITIAFRASVINIGGEGQIIAGAVLSTSVALAIPDTTRSSCCLWSSSLVSRVYHWDVVLSTMIEQIEDGTLGGEAMLLTLENSGLVMEFNGCYDLDSSLRSDAEGVIEDIISGDITTK